MTEVRNYLSTAQHWDNKRAQGYNKLGWAKASGPLDKIVELAQFSGTEIVVDAGTGSQIVLDRLSSALKDLDGSGIVVGFDVSWKMLTSREGDLPTNARLLLADFYQMPFPDSSISVLTTRHVLHNLLNTEKAVLESRRVLGRGGKFIGVEYVAVDDEVLDFERKVFDLKEPGRNLWTGRQFRDLVACAWFDGTEAPEVTSVKVDYHNLENYSVVNWMSNSGLPFETQQQIINLYRNAPLSIAEKMRIICTGEDVLTDRLFAYVVVTK